MIPAKKNKKIPLLPVLAGLMILLPLLVAAGCTGKSPLPSEPVLHGTGWTLTDYLSNGTVRQVLHSTTVTLDFGDEGRISGSAGCNQYFAGFEREGTNIRIGQAGSTMMYCPGEGVMAQETAYLALLGHAATVAVDGDRLSLADAKGMTILSFTRTVPPVPEPLVGTNWSLASFHTASAVSSVMSGTTITAVFSEDGRMSGSAGCNRYFATYNVTGTSMSIGTAGSTKMYCNSPGVMEQEAAYLASLSTVTAFTITGDRLSLVDAQGTTLLTFTAES